MKKVFSIAFLLLTLTVLLPSAAHAQNVTVNGTVVDVNGAPVEGVAIMIVGNELKGAVTDVNGVFSLQAAVGNSLKVSSIGYKDQIVKVNGPGNLYITIEEDAEFLDDVVVIGYGSARKGDLTSSISSVNGKTLVERGMPDIQTALQGQMAGVQVNRSNGDPASSGSVQVHGITSMSSNSPLVIVDGKPGDMGAVAPEDIETISVLKDASAASIYGARAAAGVILITTKRAKTGETSLSYKYEFGFDTPTATPKMSDAVTYMTMLNEQKWNDGADEFGTYSQDYIGSYMANNATDPVHYPNTDWLGLVLNKTKSHQKHSLTITSGTDKLKTMASFNYDNNGAYYDGMTFDRYRARVNNDITITKWMKASVDINIRYTKKKDLTSSPYSATTLPAIYNARWADGSYADVKDGCNIYAIIEKGGYALNQSYSVYTKASLEITPFKGMTITGVVAPDYSVSKGKTYQKNVDVYYEDGRAVALQSSKGTSVSESRSEAVPLTYQAFANYNNKFGSHSINATAGYEGYSYFHESLDASRTNYTLTNFPYLDLGPKDFQYNSGSAGHNAYQSWFGRVIYSFKDKYLLQASIRADASSRFAKDYRWGYFPSVSLGWVVSDEDWFNNSGAVNYLKLRASVGALGNEQIGSEFPYQAAMNFSNVYMWDKTASAVTAVQNAAQYEYAYTDISWETTTTYGVGVDANFFNNRLSFNGDVYYKKTTGMLLEVGFPTYYGYDSPKANAGDMHTKGFDIEVGWKDRIGDFRYAVSANLSNYHSIMGYLGDKKTVSGNYLYEEGSYYKEWYTYKTDGIIRTDADLVDEAGNTIPSLAAVNKTGFIKYVDVAGGVDAEGNPVPDGIINADDKVKLGNSLPEYLYGGSISLGWRNWDFNLQFQGIGKQTVLYNFDMVRPFNGQWRAVPQEIVGNYWSKYNTEEQNAKVKYPALTNSYTGQIYTASEFWLFNGAYFRVKNVSLSYSVPSKIANTLKMKGLKLYVNVMDLPAISKYPKGWDPELSGTSHYFSTSYVFGVNVNF